MIIQLKPMINDKMNIIVDGHKFITIKKQTIDSNTVFYFDYESIVAEFLVVNKNQYPILTIDKLIENLCDYIKDNLKSNIHYKKILHYLSTIKSTTNSFLLRPTIELNHEIILYKNENKDLFEFLIDYTTVIAKNKIYFSYYENHKFFRFFVNGEINSYQEKYMNITDVHYVLKELFDSLNHPQQLIQDTKTSITKKSIDKIELEYLKII